MLRWALAVVVVALAVAGGLRTLLAESASEPPSGTIAGTPPPSETPTETPVEPTATITPSPTSQRPYKLSMYVQSHFPSPAVSSNDKTWVFFIENNGTIYGCGPSPSGSLQVSLTGQADSKLTYKIGSVPCPGYVLVDVTSLVTAPPGGTVSASGVIYGVPQPMQAAASAQDGVCLDYDRDKQCDDADPDADGDGCTNGQESQTAVGSEASGGRRNPLHFWDYADMPIQSPPGSGSYVRDKRVRVDDILAVLARYFTDDDDGTAPVNRNSDPLSPPADKSGYHPAYDRDDGTAPSPNAWNVGPANGRIRIGDILAVVGQYFHDCV